MTSTRAVSTIACGKMRRTDTTGAFPQFPLIGIDPLLCIVPTICE